MSERTYSAKELFSYIDLEKNDDETIEHYLTHLKTGTERKQRTKKFREKYQKSVRILHRIFSTYYPSKERSRTLFPSFKNGVLLPKAEKRETRLNPYTEDWEIVSEDIPNIDEKVWNGLEFIFLMLIFSSIQKELPSNIDLTKTLSLRKSSRNAKKENHFFSLEETSFDKNKFNVLSTLHKDVETILDALRIIEQQQAQNVRPLNFQEDDGFSDEEVVALVYEVSSDFSIDILTKQILIFYKSYITCLFPDFSQQQVEIRKQLEQQKQTLNNIVNASQLIIKKIDVFQENYQEEPFDRTEPIQSILSELNTRQNFSQQQKDYLELYSEVDNLQEEINTMLIEYENL